MTRLEVADGQSMVMEAPVSPSDGVTAAKGKRPAEGTPPEASAAGDQALSAEDRGARRPGPPQGVLPDKAAEDLDVAWGGTPGNPERDEWLKEQRPPHWD